MQLEHFAAADGRRERGIQGAARVDDQEIAWGEPPWQVGEAAVIDRIEVDAGDEQAYFVAPEAARLRRFGGLEGRRQLEVRNYTCCSHRASSCCAANRWPRRVSASWSISQFQNGTVISGSGRSEMSSSGNASWCMRVRMSPGSTSTADTPSSCSSVASVRVSSSNAALLAPYGPNRDTHPLPHRS